MVLVSCRPRHWVLNATVGNSTYAVDRAKSIIHIHAVNMADVCIAIARQRQLANLALRILSDCNKRSSVLLTTEHGGCLAASLLVSSFHALAGNRYALIQHRTNEICGRDAFDAWGDLCTLRIEKEQGRCDGDF